MKNKITIIVLTTFLMLTILIACDSSAKKVENARENVQTSKENVTTAQDDLNQAVKDSAYEYQTFKKESEDRIRKYELNIAELKNKIAKEKIEGKTQYQKTVNDLEQKTADLKRNLNEYKVENKDKWEAFKIKFNRNMDDLGKSITNFFSSEKSVNIRN